MIMCKKVSLFILLLLIAGCTKSNAENATTQKDTTAAWTDTLKKEGSVKADLDGNGKDDQIIMQCIEKEGESMITGFEVSYDGKDAYKLCDSSDDKDIYRTEFERLETFDFDEDGKNELILQFGGHGTGGEGYHEFYVLWPGDDQNILATAVDSNVKLKDANNYDGINIDSIYTFDIVEYEGKKRIRTREYLWSEEGSHSEGTEDLVSIVTLTKESNCFESLDSWVEKRE